MLQIKNIIKDYGDKENVVHALKGVSLNFRQSEFVSILGQSGCGKTTMLNIIGGLDRYTSGDLIIDGMSTKNFKDVDWDTYRNVRIGFIFQSYNLISHINILANVEMALVLSGISAQERRQRAIAALEAVGLKDQLHKRPNQLSGGQMQRVSIARALINNPDILLADEPTGALDSNTSVQIMDMLKEIAKDRLVIMVTHNKDLAEEYSTRIISLKDGLVIDDTNPYIIEEDVKDILASDKKEEQEVLNDNLDVVKEKEDKKLERQRIKEKKKKLAKTSMSFLTAIKLSFNNLMTKKGRTILTAIAASIGIIGVSLVLAISNGFTKYVDKMQTDMLAGYPVQISQKYYDIETLMGFMQGQMADTSNTANKFPTDGKVSSYQIDINALADAVKQNKITDEYIDYLEKMDKSLYGSIYYSYDMNMYVLNTISDSFVNKEIKIKQGNLEIPVKNKVIYLNKDESHPDVQDSNSPYQRVNSSLLTMGWDEITGEESFINSQYDLMYGRFPKEKHEVMLVLDTANRITEVTAGCLGLDPNKAYTFEELLTEANKEVVDSVSGKITKGRMTVYTNNEIYELDTESNLYKIKNYDALYNSDAGIKLEVVGIYRQKEGVSYATLNTGICYLNSLTQYMLQENLNSDIVNAQKADKQHSVITGNEFATDLGFANMATGGTTYNDAINSLGGSDRPTNINIYPVNFEAKEKIVAYLDKWNETHKSSDKVQYTDMAAMLASMLSQMIKILTIALTCFSAVSLFVSSFMIGIITYVSVVERTKEIGILRSLGARKKDIARVFNAETGIIGFAAGVIGVLITYILHIPINLLVNHFAGMTINICALHPVTALLMIALSMCLTLIAGLFPSSIAAKKDPVLALSATN